ncbi:MAG: hypothetical protein ACRDGG_01345 [Anaerolineae bacterium]
MTPDITARLSSLLSQAGSAHHVFEQTAHMGVYDQDWPAWYADHLIEHGLSELIDKPVTAERLSQFLLRSNEERKMRHPEPGWAEYTARDLLSMLDALG